MTNAAFTAAIEPSSQMALFSLISLAVTTLGGVVLAWIALKQAQLARDMQDVKKHTNSLTSALVTSTDKASRAEAVLQEKAAETLRKAEIVIAIGQQSDPPASRPAQPAAATVKLAQAIEKVPEKTAVKVVEKLADK